MDGRPSGARSPWYALETAKALVQAYGRSCRHAADHGVTYVLDAHFARFLQRYRPLLPAWFREARSRPARREGAASLRAPFVIFADWLTRLKLRALTEGASIARRELSEH